MINLFKFKKPQKSQKPEVFSFGEPVPVRNQADLLDYVECWLNDDYYEPPIDPTGLAQSLRANSHHASAIQLKKNIITSSYEPHPLLNRQEFSRYAQDYLVFGNAYIEVILNRLGKPLQLRPSLAKYTRRGPKNYWYTQSNFERHKYRTGSIYHLQEASVDQEVYGVPGYIAALNSVFLSESATLFRRKYYENGAHSGYIMYLSDPGHDEEDIENLKSALKEAKGPGNFRNLFMHTPDGKKDGLQIIPISSIATNDEFFNIKTITQEEILIAHRVPPILMGVIPKNTGGFGDVKAASTVFYENELKPLQQQLKGLNEWLGIEVIKFNPYVIDVQEVDERSPQLR